MKKIILALALASIGAASQAADVSVVKAIQACNTDFFKAVKADKNIPEGFKVQDGDMAYLKIEKQPLEEVLFPKPFKEDGLTVTGYIVQDEIVRYFGTPDMHTHFWGLTVKEKFKDVVDAIKLDWEAVDMNHTSAHANRMVRFNGDKGWKKYQRDPNYSLPDFGMTERAFHVAPYKDGTMIFCAMQSAGAPETAIIEETRPDLLQGEKKELKKLHVREEKMVEKVDPHAVMN